MSHLANKEEVELQSQRAFSRWKEIWKKNAAENKKLYKKCQPIIGAGRDKSCIVLAFGPSFKDNMSKIKANNLHYYHDIFCVDKALKSCIENGIVPKYVMVADAQVDFEKWGKISPEYCKHIKLIMCVTGNSDWTKYWSKNGGDVYFVINKDGIKTHNIYREYLDYRKGESIIIPAASNVGNSSYVFAALHLGYKEILLAAYDYSFAMDSAFYGISGDHRDTNLNLPKHSFNNHYTMVDVRNNLVQVSNNMWFSARWLIDFIKLMEREGRNTTVNITGKGILKIPRQGMLVMPESQPCLN